MFYKNKFRLRYNSNFFYNEVHLIDFIKIGADEWVTPFISGTVIHNYCRLSSVTDCEFVIVSRRDKRRCGCRFIQRGCDLVIYF